jgi:hypothetical protein
LEKTEDTKWVISRIDELFQEQFQMIEYEIKNSEEFREREVKRFKDTEKGTVSFMVILSSLVFGFNQIGVVGVNYVGLIAMIFVGGSIVYLITGIFTVLNKKIFDEIHNNLVNGTTQLYGLKSHYLHQTILLENSKEEFEGFANYLVKIASSSLHIPVYYKYQECLQSLRIFIVSLPAKRQIESSRNILKSILDDASVYYKNNKNLFESNSLLKDKLYFGTDLLAYQENPIKKKLN